MSVYARLYSAWVDYPDESTIAAAQWFANVDDALTGNLSLALNGGSFVNSYDTALWIAPARRTDPTNLTQAVYVQHRVAGDLGSHVHDAAATELRIQGGTNGGTGQNALESSLVVTGGVNDIASANGMLANFHTEGSPTGSFTSVALMRSAAVPTLATGFAIAAVYGMYVERQTVGTTNYSVYAPDGDSVFGQIVPKTTLTSALVVRGLSGQGTTNPLFVVQNSTPTNLFSFFSNGTGGIGGTVSSTSFYINNNIASTGIVNLALRTKSGQTADAMQIQDGSASNAVVARFTKTGYFVTAKTAAPADADLNANELTMWVDATVGATKAMFKAKDSGGTVRTGSVSLT